MDWVTIGIGLLATGFGTFTLHLRSANPSSLRKLEPMKKVFGATIGNAIHFVAYSILPLVMGAMLIYLGVTGSSILEIIGS